jgi:hypothetical protein
VELLLFLWRRERDDAAEKRDREIHQAVVVD